jgi:cyclopropane fatty-acyl-phospholipid synthase-like methyltransferase
MTERVERGTSFGQDIRFTDVRDLVAATEYERAKSWSEARISYLEGILREMPHTAAEVSVTDIAAWQKLRNDLTQELQQWHQELETIKSIIQASL